MDYPVEGVEAVDPDPEVSEAASRWKTAQGEDRFGDGEAAPDNSGASAGANCQLGKWRRDAMGASSELELVDAEALKELAHDVQD